MLCTFCGIAGHIESRCRKKNGTTSTFYGPNKYPEWCKTMQTEVATLVGNHTWTLTVLHAHKKAIGCKWVYKFKRHSNSTIERCKARLVTEGYTRMHMVDCNETFTPIAKLTTVCILLSLAVAKGWPIQQLEVNNAFLHGDLHEEVYMQLL